MESIGFVDKIIFGRTNYSKEAEAYSDRIKFYDDLAKLVSRFCEGRGIICHIKKGTAAEALSQ